MDTKHTPGPWKHERVGKTGNVYVRCSDGFQPNDLFRSDEERLANARLIAAAPDLLEAAKHLSCCDFPDEVDFRCDGCNAARAAIAKAEGR